MRRRLQSDAFPKLADLTRQGWTYKARTWDELVSVDIEGWLAEVPLIRNTSPTYRQPSAEGLKC